MSQRAPAPGWYPDPGSSWHYRYWDGSTWTEHVAPVSGGMAGPGAGGVRPLPFAGVRAAFGRRALGYVVDLLVLAVPTLSVFVAAIIVLVATTPGDGSGSPNPVGILLFIAGYGVAFLTPFAYSGYFMTNGRRTFGQRVAKLRLVDAQTGAPVTVGKVLLRTLIAGIASGQVVGLGTGGRCGTARAARGTTWSPAASCSTSADPPRPPVTGR